MKTILGLSSAALAGATTQSIAAAANSGHTAMLNLRFTILYPFIRLFLTGWEPPAREWAASKSLRRRSSGPGDEPALDTRSSPWRGPSDFAKIIELKCASATPLDGRPP